MSERAHGTAARYKLDGCRCYPCAGAYSAYQDRRSRLLAAGTWRPFVPAEPVRRHVKELSRAGIGWRRVAELSGLSTAVVCNLLYTKAGRPPTRRLRPATAAALLAVRPGLDRCSPSALVDADVYVRRLQALIASGWPQACLGERLGIGGSNMTVVIRGARMRAATARAIRDLYTELESADPREAGVSSTGVDRALRRASAAAWAPTSCWDADTIDDPNAWPEWTGACGTVQGWTIHRRERIPRCQPCRDAYAQHERELREHKATAA